MGSFASTHPYNGGIARPVCSDRSSSALDVALTDVTTHWCRPLMTTDIRFSRQQIVPSVHATVHGCDWLLKFRVRDPCRKICIETIATTSQRRKNTRFIACEVFCRWNLQSKSHYSMFGKEHVLFFCMFARGSNQWNFWGNKRALTVRSSSSANLYVHRTNLHFGSRSFHIAALTVWDSLPSTLRSSQTLNTFR